MWNVTTSLRHVAIIANLEVSIIGVPKFADPHSEKSARALNVEGGLPTAIVEWHVVKEMRIAKKVDSVTEVEVHKNIARTELCISIQ